MIFTYLFHNPANGLTKIGRTRSPISRFNTLNREESGILIPKCVLEGDVEMSLHKRFVEFRVVGEWFQLSDSVVKEFVELPNNVFREGFTGLPAFDATKSVYIGPETHEALRKLAKELGHPITWIAEQAIQKEIQVLTRKSETKKVKS